jgi:integrase
MGWILQTPAGRYRVNWRDPAGRQRAKTLRTKKEARAFLAQVDADTTRGTYIDPHAGRRKLLRDFAAEWQAGRTVELTTDERTRSILRTHILPRWGEWPLASINHAAVQRWVRELSEQRARATVAKCVNVLSLILASAIRSQLLVVNPCDGLQLPRGRAPDEAMTVLTRDEFAQKLLPAVAPGHRAIVCLAAGCGLRWGEAAGLDWAAIDLAGAELHVRQVAVELSGRLMLRPYPKSRAGRRTVPMPAFVVDALTATEGRTGLVAGTRAGTPLRRSNFRRSVWVPAVEASGLPADLRYHDLRHSYATWLVSDGVPINVVSRLMGHEQITTTLNRYTHDARDYEDLQVRKVFDVLTPDESPSPDEPEDAGAADDLLTSDESEDE